jgi:hypothetical protein
MARAQAQYLRIFSNAGATTQRWQSYYANDAVVWQNNQWTYVPFIAEGFTNGMSGDESNVLVRAPATTYVIEAFENAINSGLLAELQIYEFDALKGNESPQLGQLLIGAFTGQVIGGTSGLTSITLSLGSALSPVGSQIPPRSFTTQIMGQGCRL